jgi:hypothetical protein
MHTFIQAQSGVVQIEAAAKQPKQSIPISYAGAGLLRTLERLGFEIPPILTKVAAEGRPLGVAECQIDFRDLDARLKNFDLTIEQKMRFKCALTQAGLLA